MLTKDIVIPDWYNDLAPGDSTMELEIPWLTRGAIYRLNELLDGTERVLEFGAGGSTLFFARRCKSVISFEGNPQWFAKVRKELELKDIQNVTAKQFNNIDELAQEIGRLKNGNYNCTLIDSGKGIVRDHVLQLCLDKMDRKRSILVLDNHASSALFPQASKMSVGEFISHYLDSGWKGEEYRQRRWGGKGTRIFHSGAAK